MTISTPEIHASHRPEAKAAYAAYVDGAKKFNALPFPRTFLEVRELTLLCEAWQHIVDPTDEWKQFRELQRIMFTSLVEVPTP